MGLRILKKKSRKRREGRERGRDGRAEGETVEEKRKKLRTASWMHSSVYNLCSQLYCERSKHITLSRWCDWKQVCLKDVILKKIRNSERFKEVKDYKHKFKI